MARCLRVGILFAGLLLGLSNDTTAGVLDFTCVTKPRVDIETENASITSYFLPTESSTTTEDVQLTFSRVKFVNSDNNITGTTERMSFVSELNDTVVGAVHRMGNAGKEMVGAFACRYGSNVVTKTFIMSLNTAGFLPNRLTQTVDYYDKANLTVTATGANRRNVWRKHGNDDKVARGTLSLTFNHARRTNSSIFEICFPGKINNGTQAFVQLFVRGCRKHKWNGVKGPCSGDCPICFNGGICNNRYGTCVCPPGFSGNFCEVLLGPNRFGQKGSLRCDGPGLVGGPTCEGKLFCLANPYGCSCAAGYKGIDCDETCVNGTYGADCLQTCHCMGGAACNKTTGECPGECTAGFLGINCQEKCLPYMDDSSSCTTTCTSPLDSIMKPENVTLLSVQSVSAKLSWNPVFCPNSSAIVNYVYRLTHGNWYVVERDVKGTTVEIKRLYYCADYTFEVAAKTTKGIGPYGNKIGFSLPTVVPGPVRNLTVSSHGRYNLRISWAPPRPIHYCRADSYNVTYALLNLEQCQDYHTFTVLTSNTSGTSIALSGLKPYSTYRVNVTAGNEGGYGATSSVEIQTLEENPKVAPVFRDSSASHNSITFSWNHIPCGSRGGRITYKWRFKQTGEEDLLKGRRTAEDSVKLHAVSPCTSYSFKVCAIADDRQGPWTNWTQQETAAIVPDAVEMLTVTPSAHDHVRVSWNAPNTSINPCNATEYLIKFELLNLTECRRDGHAGIMNTSRTSVSLEKLEPISIYNVSVTPINTAGYGPTVFGEMQTGETKPEAAPELSTNFPSETNITFTWNDVTCGKRGGHIIAYNYEFRESSRTNVSTKGNVTGTSAVFENLSPCSSYIFKVRAYTRMGPGPWTNDTQQQTVTLDAVQNLTLQPGFNEIHASWTTPGGKDNPCPVTRYRVTYELLNMEQCEQQTSPELKTLEVENDSHIVLRSLHAHSTYRVHVVPAGNAGKDFTKSEDAMTYQGVPTTSPRMKDISLSGDNVNISWLPIPCGERGGVIAGYVYELLHISGDLVKTGNTTAEFVTLNNLSQGVSYVFRMQAFTRKGRGPSWKSVNVDVPNVNRESNDNPSERNVAGLTFGVIVCLLFIVAVILLLAILNRRRKKQKETLNSTDRTADGTKATDGNVGNEEDLELQHMPSTSCHEPCADSPTTASTDQLQTSSTDPSTSIKLATNKVRILPGDTMSSSAASDTSKPGPSTSAQAAVKPKSYVKSTKPKLKTASQNQPVFSQTGQVAMAHLAQYIKSRKSGKINGFQQDYETIPSEPLHPWTVAKKDYNRTKNRYTNILPYDHSRVVLETLEDNPETDYINASYINGYKHKARYIACQGPTVASVNDMWRMVWQERVGKIVMLANLVENGKGKCEQYWPDDGGADFGEMFVRNVDEASQDSYIVRTFHLSKKSEPEGEYRVVTQFHYTTWPDMKPPEASLLLQFLRKVRASETTQQGPIVVHCSAGVGRTGTFIALDAMLEQAQAEGHVDVLSFARDMREQRFLMVQTLDQYKFIFDALLESMLSENTAIPADRFQHDYAKLKKRDKKTGTSGIEDQFQMLESFNVSPSSDQCAGGLTPANVDKNRFKHCIPKDSTRPYLMTESDEGSTNYINAAFLDGYKGKNAYIGTQAPLPNTVGDIWRMVFDYKSTCIVMLNSMDSDPRVAKYWPEKDEVKSFGPLNVTLRFENRRRENLIIRHFEIVRPLRKSDDVQSVCQIQYLGWPTGKDAPDSAASLLQVLLEVRKWTDDHPDGPITVHCIDGVECTGVLCILITLLDHLKEEKVVDVFQAVKKLRTIRPGVVHNLAQYQFCYKVIQTYLDSSSVYENLK